MKNRKHTPLYRIVSLILVSVLLAGCVSSKKVYTGKEIDLYENNGMHFLDITVNGIKTKLLIDTGANKSLLDISQAGTYGFNFMLFSEDHYIGLGGLIDIYVVYDYTIDEFFIPLLGSDLSQVQDYFLQDGIHIIGILGSDFLEQNKVSIDFEANKLYLN